MPPTPGKISAPTPLYNKKMRMLFTASPFLFLTSLQRLTNHYYKQMHTIRIGNIRRGLEHVEVLVILELVTVKTIVSVAQHYLGKLVERVVYTQSSGVHVTATDT